MKHPTNDMLLAYVRRQQCSLWPADIQEHIASCPLCSAQCTEFKLTGSMLETWAHTSSEDLPYAIVSRRVMRTIKEPKITLAERIRHSISQIHVALPVATVVVLFVFVLLVASGVNIVRYVAKSQKSEQTQPKVSPHPTVATHVPIIPFTPIPTVAVSPTAPVVSATPHSGPSIVINTSCTIALHIVQDELRVCGAHFTPKTTVAIYYHIGTSTKKHNVQVAANGTFTDVVYIGDCNDVPSYIYAKDAAEPSETAQITQNISFGTCQRS